MRHARDDYNRIQDPAGKIGEEEPVFLIRGQDVNGPSAVREYAKLAAASGAHPDMVAMCMAWADHMAAWQLGNLAKVPDLDQRPAKMEKHKGK